MIQNSLSRVSGKSESSTDVYLFSCTVNSPWGYPSGLSIMTGTKGLSPLFSILLLVYHQAF